MALTGPILGVIIGGYVFNSIGGYNDPKALPLAIFMVFMAAASGAPIVFLDDFHGGIIL